MTPEARRKRAIGQFVLLAAGFFVLAAISMSSIVFVEQAREDNAALVHTIEVESQISGLLLQVRRAESAARAYLLTRLPAFLAEHREAVAQVMPLLDRIGKLVADNPAQLGRIAELRAALDTRLDQFARELRFVQDGNDAAAIEVVREAASRSTTELIRSIAEGMRAEEDRLFVLRTVSANHSQARATTVTLAGSGLVVLLAGLSVFLVRRSSRARDEAEARLRENALNLETIVDARTADLREANNEIQRFAYIVSHDLRSPLVNIMGFTSELDQLRGDIFRRIAALRRGDAAGAPDEGDPEAILDGPDRQLAQDFGEALGFIKSSIGKMDRLINAILNLTREGRREFEPEPVETGELIEAIVSTLAHQASEAKATIEIGALPRIISDRLALEQVFSNLIDNAIKYLKPGIPGEIRIRARTKLGFAIFEIIDNGRGIDPKDHQRIFDLFRRAGAQDRPGQGIGLAHVRALVRRLGGTMSVSSELNHGSTFTITLPIKWTLPTRKQDA